MAKRTKKSAKQEKLQPEAATVPETAPAAETPWAALTSAIEDPIGDVSSGEARAYLGDESAVGEIESVPARAELESADESDSELSESEQVQAELQSQVAAEAETEEPEFAVESAPEIKLERLQKILSQAGIASRRRAEELITEGRMQVNGTVVTELGSKADPAHDHIRVDGKLLHGAERHRYFVLNKPKGYVTTVSDPEGRPTVMTFFAKMRERLYPVGRLDYQSEGLLLVTNDGELANQLTNAGSGVEKTYLVKVAGRPTEEELERLRSGIAIEHGAPGSKKVHTAPARVRQVRQGENPWYEVVLIEGRNRELRKMFSAIGHFVEKIRRVGYGPLVLDVEPGKLRELRPEEVASLRLAAEGKLPKKSQRADRAGTKWAGGPARISRQDGEKQRWGDKRRGNEKPRWGDKARGSEKPRWSDKQRGPREQDRRSEYRREDRPQLGDRTGTGREGRFGAKPARGERAMREDFRAGNRRDVRGRRDSGRDFAARSGRGFQNRPLEGKSDQDRPAWVRQSNEDRRRGKRPAPARSGAEGRFGESRARRERPDDFRSDRRGRDRQDAAPRFGRDRSRDRAEPRATPEDRPGFGKFRGGAPRQEGREAHGKTTGGKNFGSKNFAKQGGRFQSRGRTSRGPQSNPRGSRPPGNRGRS